MTAAAERRVDYGYGSPAPVPPKAPEFHAREAIRTPLALALLVGGPVALVTGVAEWALLSAAVAGALGIVAQKKRRNAKT